MIFNVMLILVALVVIVLLAFRSRVDVPSVVSGKVIHVYDGDTFLLRLNWIQRIRVRIAGIDAPEHNQAFGDVSGAYLTTLIEGARVTISVKAKDDYGRFVALVSCDERDVGYEMVSSGLAWSYSAYWRTVGAEKASQYRKAQNRAYSERIGLWVDSEPMAPWVFREKQRTLWSRFLFSFRRWLRKLFLQ